MFRKLLKPFRKKTYHQNLYTQLANMQIAFDLSKCSEDQLINIWGNTWRLIDGMTTEMEKRGMDHAAIFAGTEMALKSGALEN